MRKKIIIPVVVVVLAIIISQTVFKKEEQEFELFTVERGTVSQEVSETGQVKKGEERNVSFKNSGIIEAIYVKVGDNVEAGQSLARLDVINLSIQLKEFKASLAIYQAQLDKLLAGATVEEIQVTQTKVDNTKTAYDNAKQNLTDIEADAQGDIDAAYEDALNTLDDAYLKAYNSLNDVNSIYRTYFTGGDQEGTTVRQKRDNVIIAVSQLKAKLDIAKADPSQNNIDSALSQAEEDLGEISNALIVIREICEEPSYRDAISLTDKASLDAHRTNINTALTNIVNDKQTISSTKVTNSSSINTAEASVSSAEGAWKVAQNDLNLLLAGPRPEDLALYKAQVDQAQARVDSLNNQIYEGTLRAPVKGQVTSIEKRVGEMVQAAAQASAFTILPTDPYEIEVDIYEEDIVKVNFDNPVEISLIAFPKEVFMGRVVEIDPAEKLVAGVVYYEITIAFDNIPEGLRAGMTADLLIKTAVLENVLIIPEDALFKPNGEVMVKVLKDEKTIEEREIEIGLMGSDDMVEIVSGLTEGEKVILD